ncbi:MAG: DUF4349 domain-containing protein [Armatimonadetes bacterium]|nr:DUF4349 domain-containing protein [Armatimonadota bacterium]
MRSILLIVASIPILLGLGCGSGDSYEAAGGEIVATEASDAGSFAPTRTATGTADFAPIVSQRAVIRTAELRLKVESAEDAERQVTTLVDGWGGYVERSESSDLSADEPTISMTVRVPETVFSEAIQKFEELGVRLHKSTDAEDVTSQLVDLGARVKNLKSREEVYRQILRAAKNMKDVLDVQSELTKIRGDIESLEAHMKMVGGLAALSTITLTLEQRFGATPPVETDPNWAADTWAKATGALVTALRGLAVFAIYLFVYAPIWLPILFILWVSVRYLSRIGTSPRVTPPPEM